MHRTLCSLTMLAVACLVASVADAGDFSVKDVDGPTAFAFDGFVTVGGVMAPAAAVGRFVADGRGNQRWRSRHGPQNHLSGIWIEYQNLGGLR